MNLAKLKLLIPILFLFNQACGNSSSGNQTEASGAPLAIEFRPYVGEELFSCSKTYDGIGLTSSTIEARFFQMYIYKPELILADGSTVDFVLEQDGTWQRGLVALLDFDDGEGLCDPSSLVMSVMIKGSILTIKNRPYGGTLKSWVGNCFRKGDYQQMAA